MAGKNIATLPSRVMSAEVHPIAGTSSILLVLTDGPLSFVEDKSTMLPHRGVQTRSGSLLYSNHGNQSTHIYNRTHAYLQQQ